MQPSLLVLGGSGQIGTEVLAQADNQGWKVIAPTHRELDVTDELALRSFIRNVKPSIVLNTTALHQLDACEQQPQLAKLCNTDVPTWIGQSCAELRATFVQISTDYVFNGTKHEPYTELDQPHPLQIYGQTKLEGEQQALQTNPEHTFILRTAGVFGGLTGSRVKGGNFILRCREIYAEHDLFELCTNQQVSITSAQDLAAGLLHLLDAHAKPGIYHLTNTGATSWLELAQFVGSLMSPTKQAILRSIPSVALTPRPGYTVLSTQKAEQLGMVLPYWQDAVRTYWAKLHT